MRVGLDLGESGQNPLPNPRNVLSNPDPTWLPEWTHSPPRPSWVRRRPTGDVWSPEFEQQHPGRDWVLTRILWLSGCEPGRNRLGCVDTMRRYIYIHGTPDHVEMGTPASHGCIRMRNSDIVELFDLVPAYTPVEISED